MMPESDSNSNQTEEADVEIADQKGVGNSKISPEEEAAGADMIYLIDDTPPWYVCLVLGFQQFLTMFSGAVAVPLVISPLVCMSDGDPARGYLASTVLFLTGLSTLLQTVVGVRLPIVQGPSWAFFPPILAVMKLPEWQCPTAATAATADLNSTAASEEVGGVPIWQPRLAEISGAILVASVFQTLLGLTGGISPLIKYLSPITVLTTIIMLGIGFFESFQSMAKHSWTVTLITTILVIVSSQYLRNVTFTIRRRNGKDIKIFLFKLFPVMFGLLIGWAISGILTVTDLIAPGSAARTDSKLELVYKAAWFRMPYPGQWGAPSVSVGPVLGMIAAVLASIVESIGDYFACAKTCGAPPPPMHAINRGIAIEGAGGVIHGLFGTGVAATSYSGNIGALGVTKVGSRRVIMWSSVLMIGFGLTTKFGALFIAIPDPVYAGVFMPLFAMITGMGLSMLQRINLESSRNIFIIGFSLLFSLVLPGYVRHNPDVFNTGYQTLDQVLFVLLSTGMFVAGIISCFLDNTIPGSDDERGVTLWKKQIQRSSSCGDDSPTYHLPFAMSYIQRTKWTRWVPFLPTFDGFPTLSRFRDGINSNNSI